VVIERLTGVRHHPAHVWALLRHRLGWTVQRPVRRAAERDQAAIDRWVADRWPRIKRNVQRRRACLVFFDESALSLTPNVRRSWAPRGRPPTLTHPFNWKKASMAAALCYGVRGGRAQLAFHVRAGNYDTDSLIGVLGELRGFLGGAKATLLWTVCRPIAAPPAGLAEHAAVLAGGRAAARLRARAQPGRGVVVQPQGRRTRQPHQPHPSQGDSAGPSRGPARPPNPTCPIRSCDTPACRWHDKACEHDLTSKAAGIGGKLMEPGDQPRAFAKLATDNQAITQLDASELASLRCSFCGKPREEVPTLIAGQGIIDPSAGAVIGPVYICNECITICAEMLAEQPPGSPPEPLP
jgi:ClpX C4-type zinc finger/Winged helix-turn helix